MTHDHSRKQENKIETTSNKKRRHKNQQKKNRQEHKNKNISEQNENKKKRGNNTPYTPRKEAKYIQQLTPENEMHKYRRRNKEHK